MIWPRIMTSLCPPLRHHQALTWFFVWGGRTSDWKVCRTLASVSAKILNSFLWYSRFCGERYKRGLGAISGLGEEYFRFATLVACASECDDGRTGDAAEVDLSCKLTRFSLSLSLSLSLSTSMSFVVRSLHLRVAVAISNFFSAYVFRLDLKLELFARGEDL
jgi:hypothetical protein